MVTPLTADRYERRIVRLQSELSDEGVPILGSDSFPGPLQAHANAVDALVLDELLYARHIPVHEGLRPPYGSLIVNALPPGDTYATRKTGERGADLKGIRPFVDGNTTVLIRDLAGNNAVAQVDVSDELKLLQLTRDTKGVAVQRLRDGRVKVATQHHVVINDVHEWSVRTQAREVLAGLTTSLQLPNDAALQGRLQGILDLLDLCFHRLSPQGIGATLVLMLDGTVADVHEGLTDKGDEPAIAINAFTVADRDLMVSMLTSVDGACMVENDGTVTLYKAKLKTTEKAQEVIAQQGGTRHTSAKRFSYANRQCMVVVVSADGPVTLFADGIPIVRLQQDAAEDHKPWRTRMPLSEQGRYQQERNEIECGRCERRIVFTVVTALDGSGPARQISCPICGNDFGVAEGAIQVGAVPLKPWE